MKKTIKFGIIGCGLMGREFASAAARWCHLKADLPTPEIVAVCNRSDPPMDWFRANFPSIRQFTNDYRALLANPEVEAVYCAVPHNLHEQVYCDVIRAGKHLLGEKPFGIDRDANARILDCVREHPEVFVRCASEFPYFPGCQQLIRWAQEGRFGKLIEVKTGFWHSSDMDLQKPLNWKRDIRVNGEYGCLGDLGIHAEHVPFRLGWLPKRVYADLSKIVTERPDGRGGVVPCLTWDNASMHCEVENPDGSCFPMEISAKRMSPGSTNEWFVEVYGVEGSARYTTREPDTFSYAQAWGKEQAWCKIDVGYKSLYPTVTGSIFQFGFTDCILQMWAAFIYERTGGKPAFGCFTPEETRLSHALQTAALQSYREKRAVEL